MSRRFVLSLFLFLDASLPAYSKPETWHQVQSQHFVIVTDASEKEARHVADQFERMRSVFHAAFPNMQVDPAAPIMVIAVKNEKDF